MTTPYTIWTVSMRNSTHGGMAHLRRFGDDAAKCGADAAYPTDRTEYQRVVEDAAKGGATVYPCGECFGPEPDADGQAT